MASKRSRAKINDCTLAENYSESVLDALERRLSAVLSESLIEDAREMEVLSYHTCVAARQG